MNRQPFQNGALAMLLLIGMAAALRADELDDAGLGPLEPSDAPASAAPSPLPKATAPTASVPSATDLPTGEASAAPPDVARAWNTVTALARIREAQRREDPHATFRSWQVLRVREDLEAALAGAPQEQAPIVTLIRQRLADLTGDTSADPDALIDPGLTEELAHDLYLYDRADSAPAIEAGRRLAQQVGNDGLGPAIQALALRRSALTPILDRTRALVHGPMGSAWLIAHLSSADHGSVQAALDALEDAATTQEQQEVLASLPTLPSAQTAANAVRAVATRGNAQLVGALDRLAALGAGALALAASETKGRLLERQAAAPGGDDDTATAEYRELAEVHNRAGLTCYKARQWHLALSRFQSAQRLDPQRPTYIFNVGLTLHRMGDTSEGVEWMVLALDAGVDEPVHYQVVINALRDLGDRPALLQFLEARTAAARRTDVMATLALNEANEDLCEGNAPRALSAIEAALSRAVPEAVVPALLCYRGDACLETGDIERARKDYNQALVLCTDYRHAVDGMKRVQALTPGPAGSGAVAGTEGAPGGRAGLELPDVDTDPLLGPIEPSGREAGARGPAAGAPRSVPPSPPAPGTGGAGSPPRPVAPTPQASPDPDADLGL